MGSFGLSLIEYSNHYPSAKADGNEKTNAQRPTVRGSICKNINKTHMLIKFLSEKIS